jgi:hypothetical protein
VHTGEGRLLFSDAGENDMAMMADTRLTRGSGLRKKFMLIEGIHQVGPLGSGIFTIL